MARVHNQLSRGPWGKALKNLLGDTKGEGSLERYGETLQPIVDLWSQADMAYLRDETLWCWVQNQAAVIAEFGTHAVSVSPTSNLILIVDKVAARGGTTTANIQIASRATVIATLAAGSGAVCRDNRAGNQISAAPQAPVETWIGSDAATLNFLVDEVGTVATGYSSFNSPPFIVRPGTALVVQAGTVNVSQQVTMSGRVRVAQLGELRPS